MDDLAAIAEDIRHVLQNMTAGTVLALWRDGSFTVEHFAFWGRSREDGSVERPLATFVAGGHEPSIDEVVGKLQKAVEEMDR